MRKTSSQFLFLSLVLFPCVLFAQQKDSIKLYLKCRNELLVSYFDKKYEPAGKVLHVKGGRLVENKDNDRVAIVPDSAVVVLEARQNGKLVNSYTMYSKAPPEPIFEAKVSGKTYWPFRPASGPLPTSIEVAPVADVSFKEMVPNDANYIISEWEVSLNRNGKSIRNFRVRGNKTPGKDFSNIRAVAQTGDVIQVSIITMRRKNAIGEMVPQPLQYPTLSYTIKP